LKYDANEFDTGQILYKSFSIYIKSTSVIFSGLDLGMGESRLMAVDGRKQSLSAYTSQAISSSSLQVKAIYLLGFSGDICYTPTRH